MKKGKRFRYAYYAAYRGMIHKDSLFENVGLYFKYDDLATCIDEGSEWYRYNAHDDYLAFLEYDDKYKTITQVNRRGTEVTLHYIDGSWYNTNKDSLEKLKELLNKGIDHKIKKEGAPEFKYMYYAAEFAKDAPVITFFENSGTFFKYNNLEECIKLGKKWYKESSDDRLTFFRYDVKHNCITQLYLDLSISTLYLMDGSEFNSTKDKIEELKELLIQEGNI